MTSAPRIAIPEPTSTDEAYNQRSFPQYIRAVEAAGGEAVPIPLLASPESQARLVSSCAAVLLPGSPADVDPGRYGEAVSKECAASDGAREKTDELLLNQAFSQGKPILGICYGLQSLNVWRQGTLIQDLPHRSAAAGEEEKLVNHEPGKEVQRAHPVVVEPDSRLARAIAKLTPEDGSGRELLVNSSHHQAVAQPGRDLRVAARSPIDGVVEALEACQPGQFVLAVQWHPERSYESSPASRDIFAAFLDAARSWESLAAAHKA